MHAGIMFNDITPLLLRPAVFKDAVDMFVERYRGMGIAAVAGKKPSRKSATKAESSLVHDGPASRSLMPLLACCPAAGRALGAGVNLWRWGLGTGRGAAVF
jgi:hypothetical protein